MLTVVIQLRLQHPQLPGARHGQAALGLGEGFRSAKVSGFSEKLEPFLVGFGSRQLMGVEKFLPSAFAGAGQGLRGREGFNKGPGRLKRPILKSLQGRGVIFIQGRN